MHRVIHRIVSNEKLRILRTSGVKFSVPIHLLNIISMDHSTLNALNNLNTLYIFPSFHSSRTCKIFIYYLSCCFLLFPKFARILCRVEWSWNSRLRCSPRFGSSWYFARKQCYPDRRGCIDQFPDDIRRWDPCSRMEKRIQVPSDRSDTACCTWRWKPWLRMSRVVYIICCVMHYRSTY